MVLMVTFLDTKSTNQRSLRTETMAEPLYIEREPELNITNIN
jgi:hypothetical protein